jgi:hypothetical protein
MINVQIPSNALMFLLFVKKIVNVELLNTDTTINVWFDFETDERLMKLIQENRE